MFHASGRRTAAAAYGACQVFVQPVWLMVQPARKLSVVAPDSRAYDWQAMLNVFPAENAEHYLIARGLLVEYAEELGHDLGFQQFDRELETLCRAAPAERHDL
jgi:hypothetical protein